ncbi:MAG TPA: ATP-binding cassette domain-containing protein [Steroidobacteraceae bacterium]|nr:ATP-binding cassette domain-containing protein [Steroidobacteraceae bacterium]
MERTEAERGLGNLREVIALIWSEADRFVKIRLASALLLTLIASVLIGLGPVALKLVVDRFAGDVKTSTVPLGLGLVIGLYVLSQGFARSVGEIRALFYAGAEQRMVRTMSERLFAHVMKLPLRFHLDRQTGAVTQTLTNGMQGFMVVLHTLLFGTLPIAMELATIVVVLSRLDKPAFLLFFSGAIVCYSVLFAFAARRTQKAAKSGSAAQIDANAVMTDNILNYETVKYFAAETVVQRSVRGALVRTEAEWVRFSRQFAINGLCVSALYTAFLGLTVLYAARETEAGRISIGTFVLMNTYVLQIVRPVEMLGSAVQALSHGMANLHKMLELFREKSEEFAKGASAPLTGPGALEFSKVSVSYRSDRAVLKEVSFRAPAGKTLGIVGHSGSGKSTIVRLLTRLIEPDSGRILLDGVPIAEVSLTRLRESIAVVPQDTILFNDTITFNIAFGKAGSTREEVEAAARLAHLHDFIMTLPEGYETRVGERGVKLSGGEKQRVSIARAVIKQPTICVFDEATSSLDTRTEREIMQSLRDISFHRTTLVIAHRLSTVVYADHIVVLDAGFIVEQGAHEALLEQNGRYAALWRAQQQAKSVVELKDTARAGRPTSDL